MSDDKFINFFTLNPIGQTIAILFIAAVVVIMLGLAGVLKGVSKIADALEI